jgi:hypothetical protein
MTTTGIDEETLILLDASLDSTPRCTLALKDDCDRQATHRVIVSCGCVELACPQHLAALEGQREFVESHHGKLRCLACGTAPVIYDIVPLP